MKARALICDEDRHITLETVELREPGPDDIVVDTRQSGVSIGTELNLINGNVSWGATFPICTGYQAVGEVEAVGESVSGYEVGDRVYYRGNLNPMADPESTKMELADGTAVSLTTGTHCSKAIIDPEQSHGIGHVPEGVGDMPASSFVMPGVGLNGVNMAGVGVEDTVLVQGTGLIGLGVVAAASQRGAEVIAVDLIEERLEIASEFGADHLVNESGEAAAEQVEEIVGEGADIVFEATGIEDLIDTALDYCRPGGEFVFQGDYGENPITFNWRIPHVNQLTTYFPSDDGQEPCRRAVLKNMANGVLPWERAITDELTAEEAPDFYNQLVEEGPGDTMGATVGWE
jgi:threonine dehydrogenase-like Zn-dependent dehydrogenase